eukprot:PhM_4_TR13331/c0_g1_i1/m.17426/K07359/CAMKK2; calcium/calmodulin-dependent protein kinase kinase 2
MPSFAEKKKKLQLSIDKTLLKPTTASTTGTTTTTSTMDCGSAAAGTPAPTSHHKDPMSASLSSSSNTVPGCEELQQQSITCEIESILVSALRKMSEHQGAARASPRVAWMVEAMANILTSSADDMRPYLSAKACVVCGRDDRKGEQRKSGFKCFECVGMPSLNRYRVKVDEVRELRIANDVINDEYRLQGPLGTGSYGRVQLCEHIRSGQKYAAKFMCKSQLSMVLRNVGESSASAFDDVLNELEILKSIKHPNVVQIYEVIDDVSSDELVIVMELLSGGCLVEINANGFVDTKRPPPHPAKLKKIFVDALRGVQYLHQRGIVHHDIKPDNMLFDARGNLLITDFSVSTNRRRNTVAEIMSCPSHDDALKSIESTIHQQQHHRAMSSTVNSSASSSNCLSPRATTLTGSLFFIPPEDFEIESIGQTVSGSKREMATDVWALGASFYTAIAGHVPFPARSQLGYEIAVTQSEPDYSAIDMYDQNGDGLALRDLLSRMMCKDPQKRLTIDEALEHPFLSGVRNLRGYAVETPVVKNVQWVDVISSDGDDGGGPSLTLLARRGVESTETGANNANKEHNIAIESLKSFFTQESAKTSFEVVTSEKKYVYFFAQRYETQK